MIDDKHLFSVDNPSLQLAINQIVDYLAYKNDNDEIVIVKIAEIVECNWDGAPLTVCTKHKLYVFFAKSKLRHNFVSIGKSQGRCAESSSRSLSAT